MKKYLSLIFSFFSLACDEQVIENNTLEVVLEPLVLIDSPKSGKVVNEIVYIKAKTKNKEGINSIGFFINDSMFYNDNERPFRYGWNTTKYPDESEHFIKVLLYSITDTVESEPITLIINNSTATPNPINVISVLYDSTEVLNDSIEMFISWEKSVDSDFKSYTLLHSETEIGLKDSIFYSVDSTSYRTKHYKPNIEHWFWILVSDTAGLTNIGEGLPNLTRTIPPDTSELDSIAYQNGFHLIWSKNKNQDFGKYRIIRSNYPDMLEIDTLIEIENSLDTFLIIEQQQLHYYQVVTENIWGLKSYSNILPSDYLVLIGDNKFSVLNTVSLSQENSSSIDIIPNQIGKLINLKWVDFSSSQISGEIPNAIENLTNLEYLNLSSNQITGEIPNEFEKLINLEYLNLSSNQISGKIPSKFENLINLEYLNLSSNQITGEIPIILYSLTNLEKLSLNNNELFGEINTEINNLINLNDINFQENQLSGVIPSEICYFFDNGISVNLRYNRLCPPYLICNTMNEYFIFGQDTTDCN